MIQCTVLWANKPGAWCIPVVWQHPQAVQGAATPFISWGHGLWPLQDPSQIPLCVGTTPPSTSHDRRLRDQEGALFFVQRDLLHTELPALPRKFGFPELFGSPSKTCIREKSSQHCAAAKISVRPVVIAQPWPPKQHLSQWEAVGGKQLCDPSRESCITRSDNRISISLIADISLDFVSWNLPPNLLNVLVCTCNL